MKCLTFGCKGQVSIFGNPGTPCFPCRVRQKATGFRAVSMMEFSICCGFPERVTMLIQEFCTLHFSIEEEQAGHSGTGHHGRSFPRGTPRTRFVPTPLGGRQQRFLHKTAQLPSYAQKQLVTIGCQTDIPRYSLDSHWPWGLAGSLDGSF